MGGSTKLMSSGAGGVILTTPGSIASDVTVNLPTQNSTLAINGPAFSAYQSVGTTIPNGSAGAQVALQTEVFDTASCFDTSTWKFTPNVPGYYQINGAVSYGDNVMTASAAYVAISKNGIDVNSSICRQGSGANGYYLSYTTSTLVYMNGTTDYVCLTAYQNQGSSRVTVTGANNTWFNGFLARSA